MKLIFLIFAVSGLFSAIAPARATDNFSLWPRRPEALEQARRLMQEQKGGEAVLLLQPYVADEGIAGREARQICGRVNVPRYLSRMHPGAVVCTVRKGDNMARIAAAQRCPQDVIMMLNGIVEPSALKIGQKLVVVPMRLRMEIRPLQREVSVWDGAQLVADYQIESMDDIPPAHQKTTTVELKAREGYLEGLALPGRSPKYPSSERVLLLSNGMVLTNGQNGQGAIKLRMEQKDLNELALMLDCGNEVKIIYPKR